MIVDADVFAGWVAEPSTTPDDVARVYATAILYGAQCDWEAINRAIIERWSVTTLERIKELAWGTAR